MAESPTLEAFDLHTFYGSSHILHGINLVVHRGDTIGLMGRNGMGKTTLIRTLVGHLKSSRGRVMVNGKDLTRAPPHRIAQQGIAYVPEGRGIFPNLSVRENLIVAARPGIGGESAWTYERVLDTFP
ncbi:MAG TPA: ATP-binding cassette domain-containing protein, partial [Myxococcaceae bacterium]|nr:ATP-binding cassette domain-containing protein [Myxococcaceae bacterium]